VAPPFITLSPQSAELPHGGSVVLTARPQGGEAMLFSVDWKIEEGAAGGAISGAASRKSDGTFEMTYTAPAIGTGPFHVVAAIRQYPAASAVATIAMAPGR
jgi:hypothetical protein